LRTAPALALSSKTEGFAAKGKGAGG